MLYTLYYQKRSGDTVVITRSKSLLKILKIKFVTYGFDTRAFVASGTDQFDKFDLSNDDRAQYSDFEMKVNAGRYLLRMIIDSAHGELSCNIIKGGRVMLLYIIGFVLLGVVIDAFYL